MLIKILCNKLLLGRATSQLASCNESSRVGSLFSRARKTGSVRARSERRAGPSRAKLLRARASSSSSSFFPALPRTPEQPRLSYLPNRFHPPASWLAALGALGAAVQTCCRRSMGNGVKTTRWPLISMWTARNRSRAFEA
jgi:hypothetical protein